MGEENKIPVKIDYPACFRRGAEYCRKLGRLEDAEFWELKAHEAEQGLPYTM